MREINLIGGFYKSKTLPWSAQDVVNWAPVPARAGGTRSPLKLRGLPGLKSLNETTVTPIPPGGIWILFGKPSGSEFADQYSVASPTPFNFAQPKRSAVTGPTGETIQVSGAGDGWLYAAQTGSTAVIRSNDLGETWSVTPLSTLARQQRINVRNGRVIASRPSDFQYSDDNGATAVVLTNSSMRERHFFGAAEIVGGNVEPDIIYSADNGATRNFVSGFPSFGRSAINLLAGTTHLVMAGSNDGAANRFSRVPIDTPLAAHSPVTVAAVSDVSSWQNVSPSIAYGNAIFVMVTDQGQIVRSTDEGATWTVSAFTFPNPRSLEFGGGVFLICGLAGAIYTSEDGDAWTQVPSGSFGPDDVTNAIFIP